MSKYKIGFAVLLLVVLGLVVMNSKSPAKNESNTTAKNIDLLKSEQNLSITTQEVSYFPGRTGYFAAPAEGEGHPGIVMIHENRGLRPETKMAAEQLAKDGYMVLAVDLLGSAVETQEEARALTATFSQEEGIENMWNAVAFLRQKGAEKVASLGWCFGGKQSLFLALSGEKLDATVIYYGQLRNNPEELAAISWPVLGIFGDKDQVIPLENVNNFKKALDDLNIKNEVHIYPGVGHAFANPSGASYAPAETKDAWQKTLAFLNANLK